MPTTRGWTLAGAGLGLIALWYVLGDRELLLAAVFMLGALLVALIYIRLHPPRARISRRLGSAAVHDGDTVQVTLSVSNTSHRKISNISLVDEVVSLGAARFEIAEVDGESSVTASYRVMCRPRGVYTVGPARGSSSDPLRIAELAAPEGPVDNLIVYPRVEVLQGFPVVRGQDPTLAAARPEHAQRGGEDFYTLREYQRGDDLRRVHWPTSAKTDQLMIRQLETPWQSRALVLLDVRSDVYESTQAFETAVSGAATVITHLVGAGFDTDLWAGSPETIDASSYAAAMEKLALVQPDPSINLNAVGSKIRQKGGGGALVLVTGSADRTLVGLHQLLARDYPTTVLMGTSTTTPQTLSGLHRLGVVTVTVAPGEDWATEWASEIGGAWDAELVK